MEDTVIQVETPIVVDDHEAALEYLNTKTSEWQELFAGTLEKVTKRYENKLKDSVHAAKGLRIRVGTSIVRLSHG